MSPLMLEQEPKVAYLEHYPELDGAPQRILINHSPFRIGRNPTADFVIYSRQVSKEHAAIIQLDDVYTVRDLKSTNGTFVNSRRITEATLRPGDIIHVAHKEFRFGQQVVVPPPGSGDITTDHLSTSSPLSVIHGTEVLRDLINGHRVQVHFQLIVHLRTQDGVAFEALGRGDHAELSSSPAELFRLAEKCRLATDLSRLFRAVAAREAQTIPGHVCFFFNAHPREMDEPRFLDSLGEIAAGFRQGGRRMILEVHEDAVANPATMRQLRARLHEMGVGLAYDDFGAGQARLAELAEVPPDFVKLDMKLIRGIEQAPARQDLVRSLAELCGRLGVQMIAEGIETQAEADTCHRLGCAFGQGYLFGRPGPAATFLKGRLLQTRVMDPGALRERLRECSA